MMRTVKLMTQVCYTNLDPLYHIPQKQTVALSGFSKEQQRLGSNHKEEFSSNIIEGGSKSEDMTSMKTSEDSRKF